MRNVENVVRLTKDNKEYRVKVIDGIGNLTRDGELRIVNTKDGEKPVLHGGIAFTTYPKGVKTPEFYNIEAWEKVADWLAKFAQKGNRMHVHGRLVDSSYTNKDGEVVNQEKIVIENFEVIKTNSTTNDVEVSDPIPGFEPVTDTEDIPF